MNLDFEVLELENFKFSFEEMLEYYSILQKEYNHYKWVPPSNLDVKNHEISGLYSWAIQSNLKDSKKPCPPYDIKHDNETVGTFDVPTELIFGFAEKFIFSLPNPRQTVISVHPPGVKIKFHTDNDKFFKIHLPIISNDDAFFIFEKNRYNLKPGKAYLINTERIHGTENLGNSDRVHFITKLNIFDIERILFNEYTI